MKLEYDKFPEFYKKYNWVPETEEFFMGREYYLKNFWRSLCGLVDEGLHFRQNKTFIGQRKLGKTAFLVRCYNLTFWEQDEVIPFYYCFPQSGEKMILRNIAQKIAFRFLQQAVGFITKDKELLGIQSSRLLLSKLAKLNFPWFEDLKVYWEECQEQIKTISDQLVLESVWNLVNCFSSLFHRKCLLIIDEYQKTVQDLLGDNNKSVACHESIGEIVNNRNIFTIISGSQISMLAYKALTAELYNRIPGEKFAPLLEEEAHELILEYAGAKGYEGIEHDVYKLTGGNPYYIKILFTPTNKFYEYFNRDKKWESKEDIRELYDFEMLHREGEVFRFWEMHLNEKYKLLNGDPPEHKGITLRLLKYIAEKDQKVHMDELREKFPEVENMAEKIVHLRDADLLMDSRQTEEVYNFSDTVLPVVITKMHQKVMLGDNKPETFAEYQQNWFKTLEKRINKRCDETEAKVQKIQDNVDGLQKEVKSVYKENQDLQARINKMTAKIETAKRSARGKANLKKGTKAQSKAAMKVEAAFRENKTIFSKDYNLQAPLLSVNVRLANGRGNEVDFYGVLEAVNGTKPQKYALIGEVKHNKKHKVGEAAVDKFVDSIGVIKRDYRKQKAICMFISHTGFVEEAIPILERHQVIYGNLQEVVEKLIL